MTRWCKCGGIMDFIGSAKHTVISDDYQCRECFEIQVVLPDLTYYGTSKRSWFDKLESENGR